MQSFEKCHGNNDTDYKSLLHKTLNVCFFNGLWKNMCLYEHALTRFVSFDLKLITLHVYADYDALNC